LLLICCLALGLALLVAHALAQVYLDLQLIAGFSLFLILDLFLLLLILEMLDVVVQCHHRPLIHFPLLIRRTPGFQQPVHAYMQQISNSQRGRARCKYGMSLGDSH